MFVDSPEQRRLRIRDSHDLALQDWMGSAGFDRAEDHWPKRWAEAYVAFAAGEKRAWLQARGVRWFPIVGWAERGGYTATEHGNSVPRFHITWGTGPGVIAPFVRRVREGVANGPRDAALSPSCQRADEQRRRGRRRARRGAGADLGRARRAELARRGRRVRAQGAGGDRDLRRHRRQCRAGAAELARSGWASRPSACCAACPTTSTGACWASRKRRAAPSSTATACGTTPRASPTGTRSGAGTASASCRVHPRSGSTRADGACRCRCFRASIRSARSSTSCGPATTTRGSFSARRSSSASSRCRARSRIRI